MKFLLINLDSIDKNYIVKKHNIDGTKNLTEFVFNNKKIINLENNKKSFFGNLKYRWYINKISSTIYKLLDIDKKSNEKWYYILSNNILNDAVAHKEIISILSSINGSKYTFVNEMEQNLPKYILEHARSEKINEHEIKLLLVYKNAKSINYSFIQKMIKKYRKVNIYIKEKPSDLILKQIDKINKENGSFIEIIKYNKKAFVEYNVVYFVQDLRTNYPRFRLDKNVLVIDEQISSSDKYNSNITFLKQIKVNIEEIEDLNKQYGILDIASVVRKIES